MIKKKRCLNCHHTFQLTRNPNQKYCGHRACQNVRRQKWRRKKLKSDPDYRENQQKANQRWQKRHPLYWRAYRKKQPKHNIKPVQKVEDSHRLIEQSAYPFVIESTFAKSDAFLAKNLLLTLGYTIIPVLFSPFAKSDALNRESQLFSMSYGVFCDRLRKVQRDHLIGGVG